MSDEYDRALLTYRLLAPRRDRLSKRAWRKLCQAAKAVLDAECDEKAAKHQRDEDLGRAA